MRRFVSALNLHGRATRHGRKKSSTSFLSFSLGGAVDLTPTLDPIVRAAVNLASSDPGSYLPYPDALYTSTELGKISAK